MYFGHFGERVRHQCFTQHEGAEKTLRSQGISSGTQKSAENKLRTSCVLTVREARMACRSPSAEDADGWEDSRQVYRPGDNA
jgi:hypothetical protein